MMVERAIYWIIILGLIVFVVFSPFCDVTSGGSAVLTSEPLIETVENTTEPEVEVEPVVEVEPEPDPDPELSGNIILSIDTIKLDANKTRVESITIKIDNQKKVFTPLLYVYWYDRDSSDAMKSFPNGGKINFTGPIPVGMVSVKKLDDELTAHYLRQDDERREFFKVELYDLRDKSLIDTKTKSIATD